MCKDRCFPRVLQDGTGRCDSYLGVTIDDYQTDRQWQILKVSVPFGISSPRLGDFQKDMPDVSRKMLSQTLKRLEDFRLVSRTVYAEVPPRVEYRLTELGESFQPALNGIIDWALANRDALAPHDATKSVR